MGLLYAFIIGLHTVVFAARQEGYLAFGAKFAAYGLSFPEPRLMRASQPRDEFPIVLRIYRLIGKGIVVVSEPAALGARCAWIAGEHMGFCKALGKGGYHPRLLLL